MLYPSELMFIYFESNLQDSNLCNPTHGAGIPISKATLRIIIVPGFPDSQVDSPPPWLLISKHFFRLVLLHYLSALIRIVLLTITTIFKTNVALMSC